MTEGYIAPGDQVFLATFEETRFIERQPEGVFLTIQEVIDGLKRHRHYSSLQSLDPRKILRIQAREQMRLGLLPSPKDKRKMRDERVGVRTAEQVERDLVSWEEDSEFSKILWSHQILLW